MNDKKLRYCPDGGECPVRELQSKLKRTQDIIAREGFTDVETMIAKYKTVMLAANEISIEQDEENETLRAENKNLQKELASLAIESVKREKVLARLEAEVTAVVNRRGEWLNFYGDYTTAECSRCEECYEVSLDSAPCQGFFEAFKQFYNYCPNCGARMEEVE